MDRSFRKALEFRGGHGTAEHCFMTHQAFASSLETFLYFLSIFLGLLSTECGASYLEVLVTASVLNTLPSSLARQV